MVNPAPGYSVSTPFGKPGNWAAGEHTGEDYACPSGTDIVAAAAGKVTSAGWEGDYGNRVEIDTGGIQHSYSHLSSFSVSAGQQVSEGQKIGDAGTTGNSTGPHLHYEERTSPYGYYDYRAPQFSKTSGSSGGSSEYPRPSSGVVYLSKLRYGQEDSDSVWYLQDALNAHPLSGGATLPLTGGYFSMTDAEVIKCQQQHGFGNDAPGTSYVGPSQADHLFSGRGITIVNDL